MKKRKQRPSFLGKRKKIEKPIIDKSKMNRGGFYKGMPGVTTDKYDNRSIFEFVVTPNGESKTFLRSHPNQAVACIAECGKEKLVGELIVSAASKLLFGKRLKFGYFGIFQKFMNYRLKFEMGKVVKENIELKKQLEKIYSTVKDG